MVYRLYTWARRLSKWKVPVLPRVIVSGVRLIFGSYVPYTAVLGRNTRFVHGGLGVVLHSRTVMGDNCTISQGVTIGGRSGHYNVPVLGNGVFISAGAKVLGPITIGDNVTIGANAVVTHDVPPNCVVAGVPARIIERHPGEHETADYEFAAAD